MRKNLIITRKNNNLTQIDIAKKVGISERQYRSLEAGTSDGSIKIWQKLKLILNKPIDFLIEKEIKNTNSLNI